MAGLSNLFQRHASWKIQLGRNDATYRDYIDALDEQ